MQFAVQMDMKISEMKSKTKCWNQIIHGISAEFNGNLVNHRIIKTGSKSKIATHLFVNLSKPDQIIWKRIIRTDTKNGW